MPVTNGEILSAFLQTADIADMSQRLHAAQGNVEQRLALYKDTILLIERQLWDGGVLNEALLGIYQGVFREMETLRESMGDDRRHGFVIIIPVADRPQHLQCCIQSILELCEIYRYGGMINNSYGKVRVIVADDSRAPENIQRHRQIAADFTAQGLTTEYFGLEQQLAQLDALAGNRREVLSPIIGTSNRAAFYHKGPSVMRNITYLKLRAEYAADDKTLFHFIDSDQEFRVKVATGSGDRDLYLINYFHYLDRIFSERDVTMLTGKVVGDPPVSPAVMAGNFIDDVQLFLEQMAELDPDDDCAFHTEQAPGKGDAAYHDMAELFGFKAGVDAYSYHCALSGDHSNRQTFEHFASLLSRFFYGEHPTRVTYYDDDAVMESVKPARTVYTGNYVIKREGLKYFIPFAGLRLRMAGPTLGRIVRAEIGERFVSANLPMLHKRTVDEIGASEFRPGVTQAEMRIDLSGEFERQYFGDVMLFTMERLTEQGYPQQPVTHEQIQQALMVTEKEMHQRYLARQQTIREKLDRLRGTFMHPDNWWNLTTDVAQARQLIAAFISNIEYNFGADAGGYGLIAAITHKQQRLQAMVQAIENHAKDSREWRK